jgi:uncharacterized protein YndB with AHSA1/START domain
MPDKKKFEIEYFMRSSNRVLFNSISTPDGLEDWFADEVNVKDGIYSFVWDGEEEKARLISKKPYESIKFQWEIDEDDDKDAYFEFNIKTDPLTKEVALVITDFATEGEIKESTFLWDNHISALKKKLGA